MQEGTYYARHHDEMLAKRRAFRAANREGVAAYMHTYAVQHKARSSERQWVRRQRMVTDFRAFKLLRGCIDCGYDTNADALQLDHVRGKKLFDPSAQLSSGRLLFAEIAKCEVRCANCHAIVTQVRRRALKAARCLS